MDTEFTGLDIGEKAKRNETDSSKKLYKKHKFVCERFQAIQIGLCIFIWDKESKGYVSYPYNFYVLPTSQLEDQSTPMKFDAETCGFLQKYKFNWDLLFKYGISYKQKSKRDEISEKLGYAVRDGFVSARSGSFMSKRGAKALKKYCSDVHDFCFDTNRTELRIKEPSVLIQKELRKKIFRQLNSKGCLDISKNSENPDELVISKNSNFKPDNFCCINSDDSEENTATSNVQNTELYEQAEKAQKKMNRIKQKETAEKERTLFCKEYGFTEIIETMTESKKPIIGHNCFFDMVYLFRQFIAPLPDNFVEFKTQWRKEFPETYDTKHLSHALGAFSESGLGRVYQECANLPKFKNILRIKIQDRFERYKTETKCHEAGYDAYMTGFAFAVM